MEHIGACSSAVHFADVSRMWVCHVVMSATQAYFECVEYGHADNADVVTAINTLA